MTESRVRRLYGERSHYCKSGVYREKVEAIDRKLAERYANHPALIMWHISNEMYGDCHFSKYKMVAAPSLYSFKPGVAEKIREYIYNGGNFVLTYNSGIVNENDIAYECFPPCQLNDVFGVSCEETDALCDDEYNDLIYLGKVYKALDFCEIIHTLDAEVLGEYTSDFYQGKAAVICKQYGSGKGYYVACHTDDAFLYDFYRDIIVRANVYRVDAEFAEDRDKELNNQLRKVKAKLEALGVVTENLIID